MTTERLPNGMRVHLVPFAGTDAVSLLVLVKVGSRHEDDAVWGGSHFIEHLMFKGTTKRPATVDISRELDRYGAEYNAYTGKDLTGYWVKIDAKRAATAIDLLSDMLLNSKFDAKEMAREKGVIIEEIKMYEENPIMHVEDLLEDAMFEGHILGKNIAGTAESMTAMKRADVLRYRDAYYAPDRMVVVMAGNVPKNAMALIKKSFGTAKKRKAGPESPLYARKVTKGPRVRLQTKPLQQIQVALGFETVGRGHADNEAIKLLASILGGTMSSRLFIEVRERRGLCYTVRAAVDSYDDVGTFVIRAGLDASRLKLAMDVIVKEVKKIAAHGVTKEELAMAKDHVRGGLMLRLEDSSERAEFFGRQSLFFNEVIGPEDRLKQFDAVTVADVARVAKQILDMKAMSIAAIGPYKNAKQLLAQFPTL
ncbi:MAG: pitrilysin family protein [Patescibacteria group bacterium]